jgi:hypothetical protein
MKTKKMNLKAIVLSLGLVAMMIPASAMAQKTTERPGGMFGLNDRSRTSFLYRAEEEEFDLFVDIQTFQDPVPLGSGIAILIGAGLGYVALKKKEDKQ